MRILLTLVFIVGICFSCLAAEDNADTIYLNNGRSVSGIISKESTANVELETSSGAVVINRADIQNIHHASAEALIELKNKWAEHQIDLKAQEKTFEEERENRFKAYGEHIKEETERKAKETREEGEVKIVREPHSNAVVVSTVLNDNVTAMLIVDTGANIIVLSKRIGEKLGIDMSTDSGKNLTELHLPGGQSAKARTIVLKSVKIQGIEEKDVLAAVILEERERPGFKDGLLGRSFLDRFNIKIDLQKMSMVLQKLK